MLDKSIPYYNIVMRRKSNETIPQYALPEGYTFVSFTDGSELDWAEIETSVGEFDNVSEAIEYFNKGYLSYPAEVNRRTIFIQTHDFKKVATATCWWNYTGEKRDLALEWIAVKPEYQGLGLGKAVVFEGVKKMLMIEGDRDIYLHSQTWSYKAIDIYLKAGFKFMKTDTFGGYANEFEKALPFLQEKMKTNLLKMYSNTNDYFIAGREG